MNQYEEFSGDECVVLPKNYLDSAEAVSEIYEEQLEASVTRFAPHQLFQPGFFKGCLLATLVWALSGIWTICH